MSEDNSLFEIFLESIISERDKQIYSLHNEEILKIMSMINLEIDSGIKQGKIIHSLKLSQELNSFTDSLFRQIVKVHRSYTDAISIGLSHEDQKYIISPEGTSLDDFYFVVQPEDIKCTKKLFNKLKKDTALLDEKVRSAFNETFNGVKVIKINNLPYDPLSCEIAGQGTFIFRKSDADYLKRFFIEIENDEISISLEEKNDEIYTSEMLNKRLTERMNILFVKSECCGDPDTVFNIAARIYFNKYLTKYDLTNRYKVI
jgi:hypothetical protein